MELSAEEKIRFYNSLCSAIAENVAKIIGGTAYTLAGSLKGVSASKDGKITVPADFSKEDVDAFVNLYVKIIGPVAKTLAARACAKIEKPGKSQKIDLACCPDLLPAWLAELNNNFVKELDKGAD